MITGLGGKRGTRVGLHLWLVWALAAVAVTGTIRLATPGGFETPDLLAGMVVTAVVLLPAGLAGRRTIPLTRTLGGLCTWSITVVGAGSVCTVPVIMLLWHANGFTSGVHVVLSGLPYAFIAALFVPGWRIRITTLAVAAGLLFSGAHAAQESHRQQEEQDRITYNGVADDLEFVGDPPAGYELSSAQEGDGGTFLVGYRAEDRDAYLQLETGRAPGADTTATETAIEPFCPNGPSATTCSDDGGGRTLVRHEQTGAWELWLQHEDLMFTVGPPHQIEDPPADPAPARHILQSLHPATEAEMMALYP